MRFRPRAWLVPVLALIIVAAMRSQAAGWGEEKALTVANAYFDASDWTNAAKNFGQFVTNYPGSDHYAQAILRESQARFHLNQYAAVIRLLTDQQARAGVLGDSFVYWTAEAMFYGGNYPGAAWEYARLVRDFPSSAYRLEASVKEAQAWSQMQDWPRVIERLEQPAGMFQQLAHADPTNHFAVDGMLLLGDAQKAQTDYAGAERTLGELGRLKLEPEVEWKRLYKLCEVQLAAGQPGNALRDSTNLLQTASKITRPVLQARSIAMQADILEQMGRVSEAVQVYSTGLDTNFPAGRAARQC